MDRAMDKIPERRCLRRLRRAEGSDIVGLNLARCRQRWSSAPTCEAPRSRAGFRTGRPRATRPPSPTASRPGSPLWE